jgi:hypothetical protein
MTDLQTLQLFVLAIIYGLFFGIIWVCLFVLPRW